MPVVENSEKPLQPSFGDPESDEHGKPKAQLPYRSIGVCWDPNTNSFWSLNGHGQSLERFWTVTPSGGVQDVCPIIPLQPLTTQLLQPVDMLLITWLTQALIQSQAWTKPTTAAFLIHFWAGNVWYTPGFLVVTNAQDRLMPCSRAEVGKNQCWSTIHRNLAYYHYAAESPNIVAPTKCRDAETQRVHSSAGPRKRRHRGKIVEQAMASQRPNKA